MSQVEFEIQTVGVQCPEHIEGSAQIIEPIIIIMENKTCVTSFVWTVRSIDELSGEITQGSCLSQVCLWLISGKELLTDYMFYN